MLPEKFQNRIPNLYPHRNQRKQSKYQHNCKHIKTISFHHQPLSCAFQDLSLAFFEQDIEHIARAAASCSGFGSGLVPASDALLCGYMACFSCLSYALGRSRSLVLSLTRAAAAGGAANTNENGAVALLQAGEGVVAEDVFQLLRSLYSDIQYTSLSAWGNRTAKSANGVNVLVGISMALHDLYLKNAL